jgi:putative membrane protein
MRTKLVMLIALAGTIGAVGCRNDGDWDRDNTYYDTQPRSTYSDTNRRVETRSDVDTRTSRDNVWHSTRQGETWQNPNATDQTRTNMQGTTQWDADRTGVRGGVQGSGQALRQADQDFLKEASTVNQKEIEFGRLGQRQASNDRVRQFAQKLIDDHTRAQDELTTLARSKNVQIASQLPQEHRQMVDKMNQMQGAEFDREFIKHMIQGHEQAIQKFDQHARTGEDAQLKAFAQRTLPILRNHLQTARDLQTNLEGSDLGTPRRDPNQPTQPFDPNNPNNPNFPTQPTEPRQPGVNPSNPSNPGTDPTMPR